MSGRIGVRRGESEDHRSITSLISKQGGSSKYRKRYGAFGVSLLEGYLSVVAYDLENDGEMLGFCALSDSPKGTFTETWLSDVNIHQDGHVYRTNNTLWVEFCVVDQAQPTEVLEKIMMTVFNTMPEIEYVICCLPAKEAPVDELADLYKDIFATEGGPRTMPGAKNPERVMSCERELLIPTLAVREACVEDHDDLVPIFDQQSEVLSETYGDFFLAELIEAQDELNHAIVGLSGHSAVGLMSVSTDVEVGLLQSCFQLDQYDFLVKIPEGWVKPEVAVEAITPANNTTAEAEFRELSPHLIVMGGPASNKKAHCDKLCERYGAVYISSGELLRRASEEGTEVGLGAKIYLDAQQLVPDNLVVDLVVERLSAPDCQEQGWVLDGFPRNGEQADALSLSGFDVDAVVVLDIPDADATFSLVNQRVDPETGILYNLEINPPSDPAVLECLVQRSEDSEEAVATKLALHQANLESVKEYFDPATGDGDGDDDEEVNSEEAVPWLNISIDREAPMAEVVMDIKDGLDQYIIPPSFGEGAAGGMDEGENQLAGMPPNAFAITLFCLDGFFQSRAMDFIPQAFERFPDKDYCVLTVPATTPESSLVRHFTAAVPRPGTTFSHALYVMHRDSLLAPVHLTVSRFIRPTHGVSLDRLLDSMSKEAGDSIDSAVRATEHDDETSLEENPNCVTFVATIGNQVVGVVSLDRKITSTDRLAWSKANMALDELLDTDKHRTRNQAMLLVLAMNPVFMPHARFLLKETMRLFDKSVIYYEAAPDTYVPRVILQHLVPVKPRKRESLAPGQTEIYPFADHVAPGALGVTLHFLSKRLLSEPKIIVNTRIVVVGASASAAAFLEQLLFTPYIQFSSVTLVSPGGLPKPPPDLKDLLDTSEPRATTPLTSIDEDMPTQIFLESLGLGHRIRCLETRLVDIDRESKALELPDNAVLPYDVLVLTDTLMDSTANMLTEGLDEGEVQQEGPEYSQLRRNS